MRISIRNFKKQDYRQVKKWFKQYNWSPWDEKMLPEGTCFIACLDDKPIAFSNYYTTNSVGALLSFTIADKTIDSEYRHKAIDDLIDWIIRDAIRRDIQQILYFTDKDSKPIVNRLLDRGGILTDSNNVIVPLNVNISSKCFEQC